MAIMRWDPFHEFDRMFNEDWGLVPMMRGGHPLKLPALDVSQTEKDVVVELEIPAGVDPEKVDIAIEGEMLTAKGASEATEETKDKNYYRREIRRGSFERSVMLPAPVNADQAEAVYEKGIMKITIPKVAEEKAKRVSVRMKK